MPLIAKIRVSSPLPQLDKEFDYLIPVDLAAKIEFGHLVEVPFGSGSKPKIGVVCGVVEENLPRENLLTVLKLVSTFPVFTQEQLSLCKAVASRQAGTVGELLTVSIPKRYQRVESKINTLASEPVVIEMPSGGELTEALKSKTRLFYQPMLLDGAFESPDWAMNFAAACGVEYASGRSSLVVLPDFAELGRFERALTAHNLMPASIRHASADAGSERFLNHLRSTSTIGINYGLRSAAFSPAKDLGLILLWDDGDDSHIEQSSPYWTSREVLLQRAELENAKLVLASHSPSSEAIRLVEFKHLEPLIAEPTASSVVVTELTDRLDSQTFVLISKTLKAGKPVLVQIANAGWASSLVCVGCKELRVCTECQSSIWIDPSGKWRCRSCKAHLDPSACSCGKFGTRPTRLGASAFTKQMERSFPLATVVHSNGENRLVSIKSGALLVVATPGAEPEVEGGYDCIVIADAIGMVASPRLRALEQSLGKWANAISLGSTSTTTVFVGLRDVLAADMKELDFYKAVEDDYKDREDLGLPPITRIASITSSNQIDHQRLLEAVKLEITSEKVRELGVVQINTLVLDYGYSFGVELAEILKRIAQSLSTSSKSKKPGERVYRINMDDGKVI